MTRQKVTVVILLILIVILVKKTANTIHTERYMQLPTDNADGYEKCSILNTNLTNFKKASYSIIHGTADDNVHFQNAALISKALVEANVDFDNFFYADEAHSINSGPNANQHVYGLLTKKVRQCFGLAPPQQTGQSAPSVVKGYFHWIRKRAKRDNAPQPIAPNDDILFPNHQEED